MKNNSEIKYRLAHDNDFEQIYRIWANGTEQTFANFSRPENLKKLFHKNFSSRSGQFNFWVCEIDSIILGWVPILPMTLNPLKKYTYGELSIYFDKKLNRLEIAKLLIDHVIEALSTEQIQFVLANVIDTNKPANKFFQKIDFHILGKYPPSIKEPQIPIKNIYYKQIGF